MGVLGGERAQGGGPGRGREGWGEPFPCPSPISAESSLSLSENKWKTDRYICNPLPGGLYETLTLLVRGGRWRLPKQLFWGGFFLPEMRKLLQKASDGFRWLQMAAIPGPEAASRRKTNPACTLIQLLPPERPRCPGRAQPPRGGRGYRGQDARS